MPFRGVDNQLSPVAAAPLEVVFDSFSIRAVSLSA
jgi:hypothetical protein